VIAGVVGGGTMGLGIAHAFAVRGMPVVLCDPDEGARERAQATFSSLVSGGVARGKLSAEQAAAAHECLRLVASVAAIPAGADLVVESVPERLDIKQDVLRQIEEREPLVVGSNTSSLSIDILAAGLAHPERFLGFHFFNPVWAKQLVEIVVGRSTSDDTRALALDAAAAIGKDTIVVKDSAGFATSRLGLILGLEAIRLLESGIASAEDIDTAMTMGYGHPMGPLRLTDLVGLDVRLDIARYLQSVYGERFAPPRLLETMVAEGRLGKKSGEGFYRW
jgi:3-hydroxybutyryl-CoA dehydrogenase